MQRQVSFDGAIVLALAVAAAVPFAAALPAWFVADDFLFVGPFTASGRGLLAFARDAFLSMQDVPTSFYRPLPFITLFAEARAWGAWPIGFHATNLVLHALAAVLLFLVARSLTGSPAAAAAATLFFAWHPRRVEPVAWISCRPDLLATVFALFALLWFVRRRERLSSTAVLVGALAWGMAMLAKESATLVPAALLASAYFLNSPPGTYRRARLVKLVAIFAVVGAAYLVLRRMALGQWLGGYESGGLPPPHPAVAALQVLTYSLVPSLPIPRTAMQSAPMTAAIQATLAAIAIGIAALVWRYRHDPAVRIGAVLFVASAVPAMRFHISLTTPLNDRLLYLPGAALGLIVAGVLARQRNGVKVAACVATLCLLPITIRGASNWRVAGRITERIATDLAALTRAPAVPPMYIAALPDNFKGAIMLRTGVRQAVRLKGGAPERLVPLSWYFLYEPTQAPIVIERSPETIVVRGRDRGEVIAFDGLVVDGVRARGPQHLDDKYGRRPFVVFRIERPGDVYVALPSGVQSVTSGRR